MTDQLEGEVDDDRASSVPTTRYERWRERRRQRISKWDRPPEPHDWRFFVGGLGKILITTGLLMFGFVAYQLWGTGIETARAQNKLENQFEELIAQTSATTETSLAPSPTQAPETTVPADIATSVPPSTPVATETTPPTTPAATAPAAVEQDIPPIERGEALAKLEIPKIGKEGGDALYVVPGVGVGDLKKGPGHYPETPLPGQLGNAAIAGHRTTFGEPFRDVDELEPGDEIIVTMLTGERFVYDVTFTEIVGPDDYFVVTTTDPTVAELTLTSCHPVYTARQRIAVHALLQPDQSAPVGEPTYYDLEANDNVDADAEDAEASADDPAVQAPETNDATAVDSTSVGDDDQVEQSDEAAAAAPTGEVEDAFADGWFHDSAAWPQIAIWAAALIVIVICVRKISRRFRHDSIGILVGIVPFVICLYFFYQNVNRLLPPGF